MYLWFLKGNTESTAHSCTDPEKQSSDVFFVRILTWLSECPDVSLILEVYISQLSSFLGSTMAWWKSVGL